MERHNPLLDPRPDDPIEQVHDYARDIAYLTAHKAIGFGDFLDERKNDPHMNENRSELPVLFRLKWGGKFVEAQLQSDFPLEYEKVKPQLRHDNSGRVYWDVKRPTYQMLVAYGYLLASPAHSDHYAFEYRLTEKAFQLLDKPAKPALIFVSYRHKESSAFALLIQARLQLKGSGGVFIDRDIPGGVGWEQHIKEQIEKSKEFIVLLGKSAFEEGSWVGYELERAQQAGCRIIPVWHNGYTLDEANKHSTTYAKIVGIPQGYTLKEESALAYDTAIIWLLNTLGYRS